MLKKTTFGEAKNVKEIVEAYLKEHNKDGLCTDDCNCGIGKIGHCGWLHHDCVPAYEHHCSCGALIYTPDKDADLCDDCQERDDAAEKRRTRTRAQDREKGIKNGSDR